MINVINEHNDPKINEMARRIVQSYSKNESTAVKQTLAIAPTINNQEQLYEDILDIFSIKGKKLKIYWCFEISMKAHYILCSFLKYREVWCRIYQQPKSAIHHTCY